MKKKTIVVLIILLISAVLFCPYNFHWKTTEETYADLPDRQVKALMWEYSYTCTSRYHDGLGYGHEGSYLMTKRVSFLFGNIVVCDESEHVMSDADRQLVPAEDNMEVVTRILEP